MMRFIEWPWAVGLAIVLPVLAFVALVIERRSRARRLAALGTRDMLGRLAPLTLRRGVWRTIRITLALALIGFAFAGPRWGLARTTVQRNGVDVVLAIDASLSMTAPDDRPSRLAKVKQVVQQLRTLSPDDRFALIAFAGKSYILTPLTTDDGALGLYLDNLDPTVVGTAGSSLSSAIRQGTNLLNLGKGVGDRALIVMSDGEGFESDADVIAEAKRAADAGIALITVGFGTEQGSTIPMIESGRQTLKRDEDGQVVVTKYSPVLLRAAAQAATGVFVPATASDKAAIIRRALNSLKTQSRGVMTGRDLSPQFMWFIAPAFLLLLLDSLLALRHRRRAVTAAAAVLMAAACGRNPDTAHIAQYNRGTTLLMNDSLAAGVPFLDSAAQTPTASLRFQAKFNGGWSYLVRGRAAKGDTANAMLDSALSQYRVALTLAPNDVDAKWNYELALRDKKGGGGGGGGGGGPAPKPKPTPAGNLGTRQAEAILDNAEREERDVQGNNQRKNVPQPPPRGKDW